MRVLLFQAEVVADQADDGVPDFAFALLVSGGIRIRPVGHAQVGAQDVDAHLALFFPVVREPGERVYAGEADGGLVVAELFGRRGVAVGELVGVGAVGVALGDALLAVGVHASQHGAGQGEDGEGGLDGVRGVGDEAVDNQAVDQPARADGAENGERRDDPHPHEARGVPSVRRPALVIPPRFACHPFTMGALRVRPAAERAVWRRTGTRRRGGDLHRPSSSVGRHG